MRQGTIILTAILAISYGLPGNLAAQEDEVIEGLWDMSLEELTMVNIETSVGTNITGIKAGEVPGAVFTIPKEEIRTTGARHLGELLHILVPGYSLIIDNDDYIHGFRGLVQDNNTTVVLLVNGQDVGLTYNQGMSSQAQLLDLNHIQRVEILTGPGSAELGVGPLTAVINIITDDFSLDQNSYGEVGYAYGTGRYSDAFTRVHYEGDKLKFTLSLAAFQQTGGFQPRDAVQYKNELPASVKADDKYMEILPGYAAYGLLGYDGWRLSTYLTKSQFDPYNAGSKTVQIFETQGARLDKVFSIGKSLSISPELHVSRVGLWEQFHINEPGHVAQTGEESFGGKIKGQYSDDRLKVVMGGDMDYFRYGDNPFSRKNIYFTEGYPAFYTQDGALAVAAENVPSYSQFAGKVNTFNMGIFTEAYWKFVNRTNHRHGILGSGRISYIDLLNETHFSPRVAYIGNYSRLSWKLHYTNAFRTPIAASNDEIPAGGWFLHYNNPNIKTQQIHNIELNLRTGFEKLWSELRVFYSINKNIIQAGGMDMVAPDGDPRRSQYWWTFANSGDIQSVGGELSVNWSIVDSLNFKASHAMVKAVDIEFDDDTEELGLFVLPEKKRFLNYPEHVTRAHLVWRPVQIFTLRTDLLWDHGRWRGPFTYTVEDASGAADTVVEVEPARTKQWVNLNLGVAVEPIKGFEIFWHLYNIFNSRPYWPVVIRNQYVYTAPPISFRVGARFIF